VRQRDVSEESAADALNAATAAMMVRIPYALTPKTVKLIPTLGALFPRGGPVQDPVLTPLP